MAKTTRKPRKATKSQRSRSTKKLSASTLTSRDSLKRKAHLKLANELYSRSLKPSESRKMQEAVVEGVSMWPLLRPGYRIQYKVVNPEVLSPGDMLVMQSVGRKGERHWRVHRLLGRVGPYFVEAGDNSYSAALVKAEDILGRVEIVRDWNGKVVKIPKALRARVDVRFRFFLGAAHAFMFAHECKDRIIGSRRSLALWKLSQVYRAGLSIAGLKVPAILPV